ncbi:MAG: hypothetical protein KDE50_27655, partial [Caldilineaceae bacterium]|nr:hypothetical protein [Caldilineaceae bacterium]
MSSENVVSEARLAQIAQWETLDEVIQGMNAMTDDPLYPAGTNMVICRGNPAAKLMVVGEAPGPQENKQG